MIDWVICKGCGEELSSARAVYVVARGGRQRTRPLCPECYEAAVRGLGGGRSGAAIERFPTQRLPNSAQREYDG